MVLNPPQNMRFPSKGMLFGSCIFLSRGSFMIFFHATRAFAPILKKNAPGAFINISSVGGLIGIPAFGTYCASKAAVHLLSQSVRGEMKAQDISVLCVYPGPIDTDMTAAIQMEKESPQGVAREILRGLESSAEEIFPDKVSREFAVKYKADAKALEREWSGMLPQPSNA